jgi:hypothetical protein
MFIIKNNMNRIRLLLFFIFLGAFATAFQIGSMSTIGEEEADAFMKEFENLVLDIDAFGIFTHNTTIALPMFIPGFGTVWGLFSAWSTGYAFAAITSITPELESIPPLTILFLSPFGIMEIVAYSLGISRSFILIKAITKKVNLIQFIKPTLIEIGVVVGLLLSGGYLEMYLIDLAKETGFEMPGF